MEKAMLNNYHTHTWRCNHATGTEREYVEAAIARGMKTLGFADHAPYFFDGDYYSGYRMKREQLQDYVDTVRALKSEYAGQIDIKIGLEMEYYPRHFEKTMDFIRAFDLDYLIMGQHFLGNEENERASSALTTDAEVLHRYVAQVLEGAETGVFTYLAHPDLIHFEGDACVWEAEMERLCIRLKELHMPLEMNLLGFLEKRPYPRKDFFEIAKRVGNAVILGCDAHETQQMANAAIAKEAEKWLADRGIVPVQDVDLRKPVLMR